MGLTAGGHIRCVKKLNNIKISPLPIMSLPLLSISKIQVGTLGYLVPIYFIYYSCAYSLFPSQKFSYRAYLRAAYMRSKACVREMVGLFAGGYRWRNTVSWGNWYVSRVAFLSIHFTFISRLYFTVSPIIPYSWCYDSSNL